MLNQLKTLIPYKLKALSIHFLISLAIFAVLLYLILFHWYPMPWFPIDGGWQGVRIMIGVDLVLGPLLTFIIFNPSKTRRALTFDLGLIALVQFSALVWGIYLVHGQRPVAIVHWDGKFHSVDSRSVGFQHTPLDSLDAFGEDRPVVVAQVEPESAERKMEIAMAIFGSDQAEYEHPDLYRPLSEHLETVFSKTIDVESMRQMSDEAARTIDQLLAQHGLKPEELRLVPFDGRYQAATLALTPDGKVIGHLPEYVKPATSSKSKGTTQPSAVQKG